MKNEASAINLRGPAVVLAPMEGVIDAPMRVLLSERGSWSYLVTEFVRVGPNVPPEKVFLRYVPELKNGSRTPSGTPVQVQILGGDHDKMAEAASIACGLGALGIDINFGCPAPTVNRHDGGASLLKYPNRMRAIVAAVRKIVPRHLPVSAKLRLGWEDPADIHENADAAAEGGADWITIHGRTRMNGYKPPAYWEPIGEVRKRLGIPVIANGEIWTLDDFRRCREETGSEHFMLGRGALADPLLQPRVSRELGLSAETPELFNPDAPDLRDWLPLMKRFSEVCRELFPEDRSHYTLCRLKQWLKIVRHKNPTCGWFDDMKRTQTLDAAFAVLQSS